MRRSCPGPRSLISRAVTPLAVLSAFVGASAAGAVVVEDLKLMGGGVGVGDDFGRSVAVENGVVVVGTPLDDDNGLDSGAAYLFDASTGAELFKLTPDDGAAGDGFGHSVALSAGIVAVGAPSGGAGAAYLFDVSTGSQLARLVPDDGAAGDEFGHSIAIDDGVVAVGALRDDDLGDASGSAYLFDAFTGAQLEKLLPDSGGANQNFGASIALDGGSVVVGARTFFELGEGYTFAKAHLFDVSTGDPVHVLQADIENYNGDLGGRFGDAVDLDNGIVAVGAWGRSVVFDHSGAAYLFDAATGSQLAFIAPEDGADRDNFGVSISIDGGVVAIGAHKDTENGWDAGSAYLYDAATAAPIDKLLASDGETFDRFGTSIAIADGIIAVGATGFGSSGTPTGLTYLYGTGAPPTGVEPAEAPSGGVRLAARPNPFPSATSLRFALADAGPVRLEIFDVSGRRVATLVDGPLPAGEHSVRWSGLTGAGSGVPSGIYYSRLTTIARSTTEKLVLMK